MDTLNINTESNFLFNNDHLTEPIQKTSSNLDCLVVNNEIEIDNNNGNYLEF
jgi:hypothetical protein